MARASTLVMKRAALCSSGCSSTVNVRLRFQPQHPRHLGEQCTFSTAQGALGGEGGVRVVALLIPSQDVNQGKVQHQGARDGWRFQSGLSLS